MVGLVTTRWPIRARQCAGEAVATAVSFYQAASTVSLAAVLKFRPWAGSSETITPRKIWNRLTRYAKLQLTNMENFRAKKPCDWKPFSPAVFFPVHLLFFIYWRPQGLKMCVCLFAFLHLTYSYILLKLNIGVTSIGLGKVSLMLTKQRLSKIDVIVR